MSDFKFTFTKFLLPNQEKFTTIPILLLWPHHGTRAGGASEASHRSDGGQGGPLALRHCRRALRHGGCDVADPQCAAP